MIINGVSVNVLKVFQGLKDKIMTLKRQLKYSNLLIIISVIYQSKIVSGWVNLKLTTHVLEVFWSNLSDVQMQEE